jgi:8-oxo-dGTP pyrophosphatase MutT (NUDIX family)
MAKHKFARARQFGALPWRIGARGTREVMLLTSRETHRWVIPKGWPMKGRKPAEVASQEAYEEAGLVGRVVGKRPLGSEALLGHRVKRRSEGSGIHSEVLLFGHQLGRLIITAA